MTIKSIASCLKRSTQQQDRRRQGFAFNSMFVLYPNNCSGGIGLDLPRL